MTTLLKNWLNKGSYFQYNHNKVFYIDEGEGDCLLIFHGYPYNSYDFKYLLPELTKRFRVIIPDLLGMGFSDKPPKYDYSFEDHVAMYRSLMKRLNINEVHILAHDLGNSVVQELLSQYEAGDHSLSIRSIAFLNGGLFTEVYRPRLIQVMLSQSPPFIGKLLSRLISRRSIVNATCSVFGKHTQPSPELLDEFWEILNYNNGKALAWKIGRLIFARDQHQPRWIKAMQQTSIPMCFINGPADPNSGMHMAKRYGELIPNADVRLLSEGIGHWPQIEAAGEVGRSYGEFLLQHSLVPQ